MADFLVVEIVSRIWQFVTIPFLIVEVLFPKEEVKNEEVKITRKTIKIVTNE